MFNEYFVNLVSKLDVNSYNLNAPAGQAISYVKEYIVNCFDREEPFT